MASRGYAQMDNKTKASSRDDEKSALHLDPLASQSQAQGVPQDELVATERAAKQDAASRLAANRRRM